MEQATTERERVQYKALQEPTLCAAFQVTASEFPDRVALRTKGDEFSMTWAEYGEKVRDLAAGLSALGLGRGDTIALLLTNRPEFHWVDAAAMHLGATPYSLYSTYSPEQIEYLISDAENAIFVTEKAFLPNVLGAREREGAGSLEHVIVVDGDGSDGTLTLADLAERGDLPALVVCHRGVIRCALAHTHKRGLATYHDWTVPNGEPIRL